MASAAALALLLHGLLLSGWPTGVDREASRPAGSVQVRSYAPELQAPPAEAPPAADAPAPRPADRVSPPLPPSPLDAPGPAPVAPAAASASAPPAEPAASVPAVPPELAPLSPTPPALVDTVPSAAEPATPVDLAAPTAVPAAPLPQSAQVAAAPAPSASEPLPLAEAGESLPVYPTRFAPSQTLNYQLRRGLLGGSAVLDWQRGEPGEAGARYRMQLVARAAGLMLLSQDSEGGFDAAGLAPRRFTDQRLRGSARAANFLKERGRISFSGPSVEYAWVPGVQDRLSWMLQLPAIVEASPRLAAPGERITLAVIGARGDAAVWVFRFVSEEAVPTGAGEVRALKFIREPRKPNDTQAEVWLDPARHHLPVRARLGNPPDGEVLDLRLDGP